MPVVINEFESVPAPEPRREEAPQERPTPPQDQARAVEKQIRRMEERRARLRAY
jgi:hypothetical protein